MPFQRAADGPLRLRRAAGDVVLGVSTGPPRLVDASVAPSTSPRPLWRRGGYARADVAERNGSCCSHRPARASGGGVRGGAAHVAQRRTSGSRARRGAARAPLPVSGSAGRTRAVSDDRRSPAALGGALRRALVVNIARRSSTASPSVEPHSPTPSGAPARLAHRRRPPMRASPRSPSSSAPAVRGARRPSVALFSRPRRSSAVRGALVSRPRRSSAFRAGSPAARDARWRTLGGAGVAAAGRRSFAARWRAGAADTRRRGGARRPRDMRGIG
jgi:hypothetical protein